MPLLPVDHIELEILKLATVADDHDQGYPTSIGILQQSLAHWVKSSTGREIVNCLKELHTKKLIELRRWEGQWIPYTPKFRDNDFFYGISFNIRETTSTSRRLQRLESIREAESKSTVNVNFPPEESKPPSPRKIFVVHGHDEAALEKVARFLERLDLEPIILHEQASGGRTVIEKIETHGDVSFAVVLLTADDEGCKKGGTLQPRARQNVVLELGYFLGRLKRNRVCALKAGDDLEIPSDFGGVVYVSFDNMGGWKQALGKELQEAGFKFDWNKVMSGR